jgi:mRNA interferase RelE/StbE
MYSSLRFTKSAVKDMKRLEKSVAKRILSKLEFFVKQENPISFAKKLTDIRLGEYRFRIGSYRVIFDVRNDTTITILIVLKVKHRREVYE